MGLAIRAGNYIAFKMNPITSAFRSRIARAFASRRVLAGTTVLIAGCSGYMGPEAVDGFSLVKLPDGAKTDWNMLGTYYETTMCGPGTAQAIADLLSKSRAAVSNCLRLLQLSAPVAVLLEQGALDMGHARCLLGLAADEQAEVADVIVHRGLSVREAEAWVTRLKTKQLQVSENIISRKVAPHVFDNELKQISVYLGANIRLKSAETGQGKLLIDFKDAKQLKQLLHRLSNHANHVIEEVV